MIYHCRIGKIKYTLITSFGMVLSRDLHAPLRVCTVKVAIRVDHFRLDPDTESQSQIIYLFAKSCHTIWQFLGIWCPITQGTCIVVPLAEPAVIHDKEFHANIFSHLGQTKQTGL